MLSRLNALENVILPSVYAQLEPKQREIVAMQYLTEV